MKRVLVLYSNRAEEGLIIPVATRLREDPDIEVRVAILPDSPPRELHYTFQRALSEIMVHEPDLVFLGFDRVQMLMASIATMVMGVPLAQMQAGDLAGAGTWDDKVRYSITMIADLVLCNGKESYNRALFTKRAIWGEDQSIGESVRDLGVYEVGSTAFDDVNVNAEDLPPKDSFDLVLYNPPTAHPEEMSQDLEQIVLLLDLEESLNSVVWIGPNGDPGSDDIITLAKQLAKADSVTYHDKVPRPQFLGLLSRAKRVIGNSSAFFKEAPLYMGEGRIINIGTRNRDRKFIAPVPGGSDKIVRHIKQFLQPEGFHTCVSCSHWVCVEDDKCSECGKSYPGRQKT